MTMVQINSTTFVINWAFVFLLTVTLLKVSTFPNTVLRLSACS
jgi:hypothetical protein